MERYIIVVGKTSQGKSATIESLKKRSTYIVPRIDEEMQDANPIRETRIILSGNTYSIFDTPSFFDSDWYTETSKVSKDAYKIVDPEAPHEKVLKEIECLFAKLDGKISIVLFVIKGTERFTRESKDSITIMKRYFGDALFDRTIFILTNADESRAGNFIKVHDVVRSHLTAIGYNGELNNRFVDFDNNSNPHSQIDDLCYKIQSIISSRQPYSMTDFSNAQNVLKEEKESLHTEKETEMQKRLEEEKRKVHEQCSRDVKNLKDKLSEKQLQLDEWKVEATKTKQQKMTVKDISGKFDIDNIDKSKNDQLDMYPRQVSTGFVESKMPDGKHYVPDTGITHTIVPDKIIYAKDAHSDAVDYPSNISYSLTDAATKFKIDNDSSSKQKDSFATSYRDTFSSDGFGTGAISKRPAYQFNSNPSYKIEPTKFNKTNIVDEIGYRPKTNAMPQTDSFHFGTSDKTGEIDYTSNYGTPFDVGKMQHMDYNLKARGLMIQEQNKQIKLLSEDIQRLSEQPPQIVHYEYEPEEESFFETVDNAIKSIPKRFRKNKKEPR